MVYLRKIREEDMDLIYRWANDPIVRNNSFHTEPIPYENHIVWFKKTLTDPMSLQFILMDENTPIGQIRLNIVDTTAEISYSISSDFRGKGYGHHIIRLMTDEVEKNYPKIDRIIAKVKPNNEASKKLFESENYTIDYMCYCKEAHINKKEKKHRVK